MLDCDEARAGAGGNHTTGGRGPSRRVRRHLLALLVLVCGTTSTIGAFVLEEGSVRHTDELLLRQEAQQGSLVLSAFIGQTPAGLTALGRSLSPVTLADWAALAGPTASADDLSALAVLHAGPGHLDMVVTTGALHAPLGDSSFAATADRVAAGASPYATVVAANGKRWLADLVHTPTPGDVVYAEEPLSSTVFALSSLPGHPFSGIDGAVYVGSERRQDLVLSTTTHLPLRGERAVAPISGANSFDSLAAVLSSEVGSVSAPGGYILVVAPTENLAGTISALLPWLLLALGVLSTLVVATLLEISERRRARVAETKEELEVRNAELDRAVGLQRQSAARFAAMIRSSSDLTTVIGRDGGVLFQSPSSAALLGVEPEALLGSQFHALVRDEDLPLWGRALEESETRPGSEVTVDLRLRTRDGADLAVETRMTNLLQDAAVAGIVLNSRDVTDRRRLENELRHQAFHDSLTGLANRALFEDRLQHGLGRLTRRPGRLGVLFLDLDDFKAVNDGRGHRTGDALLRAVSERLAGTVRAGDTLARIGGDEFAVLVETDDDAGAADAAQRIMDALATPIRVGAAEVTVRASIGVVTTADGGRPAPDVLRDADIAMYAAKTAGKGRIEVFHPRLHDRVIRRLELELDLERAVENDELSVHYQPVVSLATSTTVGVEALMRWRHPRRGVVMPGEFIPVAESTGLVVPMGRWLLRQACADMRRCQDATGRDDLHLAVNLSARQLDDPELLGTVREALEQSGLAPGLLTLEITESVFMDSRARSFAVVQGLKALGVRLSIDDFGTGYSSLGYLHRLPADELKIDRTFVEAAGTDAGETAPLVETIVKLAKDFSLDTVAEGIETPEQLERVRRAGCGFGQGYLFAMPLALSPLLELLSSGPLEARTVTPGG